MVTVTLLWSTAGVVSRHLQAAHGIEVTFWRSAFTALVLGLGLPLLRGGGFKALACSLRDGGRLLWFSGLCWSVMFTAFMFALTLTTVANVLVTMAIGPLVTALSARLFLHHRLARRTWLAMVVGSLGMAGMFGSELVGHGLGNLAGLWVALAVPLAGALNFTLLQKVSHGVTTRPDMLPALLIGAVLSAAATFGAAWPLQASAHDLVLLAGLGMFQLALPCWWVIGLTRILPAPEIALLGLLEVVFGVLWAWLGAGETPALSTWIGGTLVLTALIGNELLALRGPSR